MKDTQKRLLREVLMKQIKFCSLLVPVSTTITCERKSVLTVNMRHIYREEKLLVTIQKYARKRQCFLEQELAKYGEERCAVYYNCTTLAEGNFLVLFTMSLQYLRTAAVVSIKLPFQQGG